MVEKVEDPSIVNESDSYPEVVKDFEAKVRYLASSLIITIPVRVARDMELRLGDRVTIKILKKRPVKQVL
jgi:hypothetical protein